MADDKEKEINNPEKIEFKKPVLIGRIGKLPKKAKSGVQQATDAENAETAVAESVSDSSSRSIECEAVSTKEIFLPVPYKEPKWSGPCPDGSGYALEVLKSGMIVDRIDLTRQAYYVFGRLTNCDIVLAHPTVSRHHAILQYKAFAEEGEPPAGWYLYELGSTHGTQLNRERLRPHHYTRLRVGHQLRFGTSSRTYILLGPEFDCEGESELTVTEIKERSEKMKSDRDRMIKEAMEQRERDKMEEEKRREEQGVDWGMGEDAEEEPDLADNPFAVAANEELYLDDPKKTLRGYFEREGLELAYDCEERGVGQYICRVELPIDDARGRPAVAEVVHRGKKKEAVVACALEACRALDRAGLLRQARHEPRRRRQRDWSADDYYDSDEDTFLDRTGAVESKRDRRMRRQGALPHPGDKPRTYDDLVKEISELESKITAEEKVLSRLREAGGAASGATSGAASGAASGAEGGGADDALDAYMRALGGQGRTMAQKAEISNAKMRLQKLRGELSQARRLAELARPAAAPLRARDRRLKVANSVVFGKRIRLKQDIDKKPKVRKEVKAEEKEFVEEMDSDEEEKIAAEKRREDFLDTKDSVKVPEKKEFDSSKENTKSEKICPEPEGSQAVKRVFGPMRPPENYVVPENYFDQETDRDLPEMEEEGL